MKYRTYLYYNIAIRSFMKKQALDMKEHEGFLLKRSDKCQQDHETKQI